MNVYIIVGGGKTKIGLSARPVERLVGMQVGSPAILSLMGYVRGTQHAESMLHEFYADRRAHGEWFEGEFTEEETELALKMVAAHTRVPGKIQRPHGIRGPVRRLPDTPTWTDPQWELWESIPNPLNPEALAQMLATEDSPALQEVLRRALSLCA